MCVIPGFPASLLDDPPPAAAIREQQQQDEEWSSEDEQSPKVRKPYTITKQREKWDKFLQAVNLYGRIEEHVGSKTAVQIRSNAQNFFSKFAEGSSNPPAPAPPPPPPVIEIPPPRPKKRPLHPYPRNKGRTPNKRTAMSVVPPFMGGRLTHDSTHTQQQNVSPDSVLSPPELNNTPPPTEAATVTSKPYCACRPCASSDSESIHDIHLRRPLPINDDASTTFSTSQNSHVGPPAFVSFQLFGQTVVVSNPPKPSSPTTTPPQQQTNNPNSSTIAMPLKTALLSCPCGVLPLLCAPLPPLKEQQHQPAPRPCPDAQPLCFFYDAAIALPFVRFPHHDCSSSSYASTL